MKSPEIYMNLGKQSLETVFNIVTRSEVDIVLYKLEWLLKVFDD